MRTPPALGAAASVLAGMETAVAALARQQWLAGAAQTGAVPTPQAAVVAQPHDREGAFHRGQEKVAVLC